MNLYRGMRRVTLLVWVIGASAAGIDGYDDAARETPSHVARVEMPDGSAVRIRAPLTVSPDEIVAYARHLKPWELHDVDGEGVLTLHKEALVPGLLGGAWAALLWTLGFGAFVLVTRWIWLGFAEKDVTP